MTPEEIPPELKAILDERAGKVHSQDGGVMASLAEILTVYRKSLYDDLADTIEHGLTTTYREIAEDPQSSDASCAMGQTAVRVLTWTAQNIRVWGSSDG